MSSKQDQGGLKSDLSLLGQEHEPGHEPLVWI